MGDQVALKRGSAELITIGPDDRVQVILGSLAYIARFDIEPGVRALFDEILRLRGLLEGVADAIDKNQFPGPEGRGLYLTHDQAGRIRRALNREEA